MELELANREKFIDKQLFFYGYVVKVDKPRVACCLHCNVDS